MGDLYVIGVEIVRGAAVVFLSNGGIALLDADAVQDFATERGAFIDLFGDEDALDRLPK